MRCKKLVEKQDLGDRFFETKDDLSDEDIPKDPPRAHGQVQPHETGNAL